MKFLKLLGLAAAAVGILTALAGAPVASATVLCKNNVNTTTCSEKYPVGTELNSSLVTGGKFKLKAELWTLECSESSIVGMTTNAGSATETVSGPVETLRIENCNVGCTVTVLKKGTFEIHHIAGFDNGKFTSNGMEFTTVCGTKIGNVHCIYVTSNAEIGTLTGGNPAKLVVNFSIARLATSSFCNPEAQVTAEYEFTAPKPLWVAAG